MKSNHLNKETVKNLRKLIGGQIRAIFVEGGRIEKAENMILDGGGMISMIFINENRNYKWRLKFHEETDGEFYSEFYEWDNPPSIKERYNPRTGEVNYDKDLGEDFKKYHLAIEVSSKENEDFRLTSKIKSIKIYHYVGEFDEGEKYDYLAIIDIETETARRIIIEEDDPKNTFYIYFDELKTIDFRLAEIHDDSGETFGKKRYQLRHEIK
jgi:hypothetical protein